MEVPFHLALLGAVPALGAMLYFDWLDAKRPEPVWTLRKVAAAGALAVLPVVFLERWLIGLPLGLPPVSTLAFRAFLCAAAPEELAKSLCLWLVVWRSCEFDERLDGIIYAARAGLGFALVENVAYLWSVPAVEGFWPVYFGRALLAVPGHAVWAGIMGFFAAQRRFDRKGLGLAGGFVLAWILHGSYDFALFLVPELTAHGLSHWACLTLLVSVCSVLWSAYWLRCLAQKALSADDAQHLHTTQQA